jgi:hypothetical protein
VAATSLTPSPFSSPALQLIRVDFNVPQDKATGKITNTQRIDAAIPTIKYALEQGAKVRPAGRPCHGSGRG